jgi:hypothetical protein
LLTVALFSGGSLIAVKEFDLGAVELQGNIKIRFYGEVGGQTEGSQCVRVLTCKPETAHRI